MINQDICRFYASRRNEKLCALSISNNSTREHLFGINFAGSRITAEHNSSITFMHISSDSMELRLAMHATETTHSLIPVQMQLNRLLVSRQYQYKCN